MVTYILKKFMLMRRDLVKEDNTKYLEKMQFLLYFPDKPHNPMVNAGAIVVTSLIKVKC
jgi:glutaminase